MMTIAKIVGLIVLLEVGFQVVVGILYFFGIIIPCYKKGAKRG
jgi:hypothetical protein